MKYCPNCGKPGVEGMKFCPQCGQTLAGLGLEEEQTYVPASEAPLKERNWFERHLNWTMVLAWPAAFVVGFIVGMIVVSIDPYVSDTALEAVGFLLGAVVFSLIWGWALRKKNRSLWWLLLGLFVPFGFIVLLCLENKSSAAQVPVFSSALTLTDKGRAAVSYSTGWATKSGKELRILETVSHSPGLSAGEVIGRTGTDIFDINSLVDAGLLRRG